MLSAGGTDRKSTQCQKYLYDLRITHLDEQVNSIFKNDHLKEPRALHA